MKKIIFILILFLYNLTFAQKDKNKVEKLITEYTAELKLKGINEFFFVKRYCTESHDIVFPPDCLSDYEAFQFWRFNNKYWIRKIDICKNHKPIDISETEIINFFIKYKGYLKKENVKKYTLIEAGKNSTTVEEIPSCIRVFQFQTKKNSFQKKIDMFNLTTDSVDKNLYFESNNKLKLVELNRMCDKLISKIENGKQ